MAMQAQIARYFVPAARTCASPLLRAGATLSEAEYLQKFATAAQMKAVEAPVQNIDVETAVKTANRIFVDLRPPAEVAITGKIKGALSMPLYTRLQELAQELKDRDAMYVVYAGASTPDKAQKGAALLRSVGIEKVAALAYEDWLAASAPIEHIAAKQRTFASSASPA